MSGFIAGYSLALSLIIAIGSQNAFVLRQGLKRQHVFIICLICFLSDALLITLGVSGFSVISKKAQWIEPVARYGGALFLLMYGTISLWKAFAKTENLTPAKDQNSSLSITIATCLALTWLNPHVYLDTLVLLGSISTQYPGQQLVFALGASLASLTFFFALGYGARILTPIFERPFAWKVLDFMIACLMWTIAFTLISA